MIPELPPSFQQLYKDSGPILRYRMLRDVLDRDESWIETAQAKDAVYKHERVVELSALQLENGSFGNTLGSTAAVVLWLCEAGAEEHPAVKRVLELVVLPTLAQETVTWELPAEMRPLVRDVCLHILARATRGTHALLESYLELVKLEWQRWQSDRRATPPTVPAYSAMVWWQPPAEQILSKRELLTKLLRDLEEQPDVPLPEPSRLMIPDKQIYLAEPVRMLHDLELGARAGIVGEVEHLRWLYDELEVQQDADGMWHFSIEETPAAYSWYYPLEEGKQDIELTVRALMIYKLLNYDV
ncbi:MAG: hypothetical protein H6505_03220 [Calditrichaeota bacterium]|nr:hypothetical protein [Calditrichota bacterium]